MDAMSNLRKYVKEDIEKRVNRYYILVKITVNSSYSRIFDKEIGGLQIWAGFDEVLPVKNGNVSIKFITSRNDKSKKERTVLWINYLADDIAKFKINDYKRVAKSLIQAEYSPTIMKPIPYSTMNWSK